MYICKVIGKVIATIKNEKLIGSSIVMVRVVSLSPKGEMILGNEVYAAADTIGCGEDNLVLVTGGANARFSCKNMETPIDMAVVGILDGGIGGKI